MLIFKKRGFFFFYIYKSSKVRGQILCETVHGGIFLEKAKTCIELF